MEGVKEMINVLLEFGRIFVITISLLALFLWLYNNTGLSNNKTVRKIMKYILLILRDKEYIDNYYPELAI